MKIIQIAVKKTISIFVLGMLLLCGIGTVKAQLLPNVPDMKGKWVAGGTGGLGMSGNYLNIAVSPQLGYRIFNKWEAGVRLTYNYNCLFDRYYGNTSWHYFGGSIYTNFQVYKGLYLHVEDELLYKLSVYDSHVVQDNSRWYNSIFVGAGYRQYISERAFVYYSLLYDVSYEFSPNNNWDTPYSNPFVIRVGYCFGF